MRISVLALASLCACAQAITTAPDDRGGSDAGPRADARPNTWPDATTPVEGPDASEPPDACTPACGPRVCGLDPACGTPCGPGCGGGQACTTQGECAGTCTPGASVCTTDRSGFQGCGLNEAIGIHDLGPRISCGAGETCDPATGRCSHASCVRSQIVYAADRSASLGANSMWTWVKDEILTSAEGYQNDNALGARVFPGISCSAGGLVVPANGALSAIDSALIAPTADATSPIGDALYGIVPGYMGLDDGRAVILLTDGDETCGGDAPKNASVLLRSGIRTYVVALSSNANTTLLDRIAQAGNTTSARLGRTPAELEASLAAIMGDIGACKNASPKIAMGWYHGCAIRSNGTLVCWGRSTDNLTRPPAGQFTAIASATGATCAIEKNGPIRCWGRDLNDQTRPPSGAFVQLAGGDSHFCGLRAGGTITCWGNNADGQATAPAGSFTGVAATAFGSCGIRAADRTVQCWGSGGGISGEYRAIEGGSWSLCGLTAATGEIVCASDGAPAGSFVRLSYGDEHGCALDALGAVRCWGRDHQGQASMVPPGTYVEVDVAYETACGARQDGSLVCWGSDSNGQASPP